MTDQPVVGSIVREDGQPIPSPFLPGTMIQYAWDSTSIGWMQECWRKYKYAMIDGWRTKSESVHLSYGIYYHSALELYDRLRFKGHTFDYSQREAVRWVLNETWDFETGKPWETDHEKKTRETLVRSVIWYLEHFKDDPAQTVALANGEPAVELTFQMDLGFGIDLTDEWINAGEIRPRQNYILTGHIDRIVNFANDLFVTDRKTTSMALNQRYYDTYKPHTQMTNYTLAGQVVFSAPVKGVLIDAAQINIGATNYGRGVTYRTKAELEEHIEELRTEWFPEALRHAKENSWPHNPQACHRYDGCQFRKVCGSDPAMRERMLESNFIKHPWNPLEPR